MLCEHPHQNVPCETCRNCRRVDSGNHPNIHQIYPDGQFIKIDQVRELIAEMKMVGVEEGRKIYVLHHADRLNIASANMILKFLEEPDGEVTAILLTEQMQSILPTIRSRCQHIKFQKNAAPSIAKAFAGKQYSSLDGFYSEHDDKRARNSYFF